MECCLADVLPAAHKIALHLQESAERLEHEAGLSKVLVGVQKGLEIVNIYYHMMQKRPLYLMAVVCDPRRNLSWIRWWHRTQNLREDAMVDTIRQAFHSYGDLTDITFESWPETLGDKEFRQYTSMRALNFTRTNPMLWWISNGEEFPTWKKIAMEVLSIPAFSAMLERTPVR
jgi:hypothetical protein